MFIGIGFTQRFRRVVSDQFNRANVLTPLGISNTGQTWAVAGNFGIIDGKAYMSSGSLATAYVSSGLSNCSISVVETTAGEATKYSGLLIRFSDSANYFRAVIQDNGLFLQRLIAGATTTIGSKTITRNSNLVLKVVVLGSSIKVYINNSLEISVTDSHNQTVKNHGLISAALSARYDNFVVEAI